MAFRRAQLFPLFFIRRLLFPGEESGFHFFAQDNAIRIFFGEDFLEVLRTIFSGDTHGHDVLRLNCFRHGTQTVFREMIFSDQKRVGDEREIDRAVRGIVYLEIGDDVKAAESFEALLLASLIQRMRDAQLKSGFFGEGTGTSTYEAMFQQHLADRLASGSPLGIADELERRWSVREDDESGAIETLQKVRKLQQQIAAEEGYDNFELKLLPAVPMK